MKNNMIQYLFLFLITMITVKSKEVSDINTTSLEEAQEVAILGGGCFWCTEAVFEKIGGVTDVVSGYAGGKSKNPTYKEICTGKSGHAEVIRITFNTKVLSYTKILEIFGKCHDTTTLNRQGADIGTQYRSTIMYLNETQKSIAEKWKQDFNKRLSSPVVTEIVEAPTFYVAEEYHQDYYARNPNQGYCNFVIRPKLKKLNLE
ncbi:MAG TPA: peptide-methionine (S)-S-oxide reductase [Opitutae bacterium]|nr:peptide-methionine (S)-S-oxide reductase [Opitutae bacterium]HCY58573.1 peptide-methionine (S)-S-oxide reductase [Opitutae bacterium]|tara:strand:+ start:2574 stop:3182 length:609 start_codon:yes stop_codon:yes gene_type:complete